MNEVIPDTCIVVPCYNEADRLNIQTITLFSNKHPSIDFLFVNDGSTDNTLSILQDISRSLSNVSFMNLSANSGKAEAVRSGFIQAMTGNFEYIGYLDADLSSPPDELDRLKQVLLHNQEIDIAIGSRVKMLGYSIERKLLRHLVGRVFATMASISLNLPVYDTQCGAKLFINNPQLRILFRDRFINEWTFDVEIIMRHMVLNSIESGPTHRIEEVPLRTWKHAPDSKVGPLDFFISMISLIKIASHYKKNSTYHFYRNLLDN